jgi:soluble lytic murein transglycosylase
MRGSLDEIGLMQIRPGTAKWIIEKMNLKVKYRGEKTLLDPIQNIRIGAAFLSYLREKFDSHARLYLAAYNMGARNVDQSLDKNIWPRDYPVHVMKYYVDFYSNLDSSSDEGRRPAKI